MPLATDINLKNTIEMKVHELFELSEVNKALILTETDLQCHLYMKLNEINDLSEISQTDDGFLTNKIHTEISWFSDNNADRLSIRPDITLLEPQNLKITSGFNGTPLPSKGLHSVDGGIIFELKFDRELRTISEKTFEGVVKDIRNFETIYNRFSANSLGNWIYGYFILLIKSSNTRNNIEKINRIQHELSIRGLDESKCKFLYHFIGMN